MNQGKRQVARFALEQRVKQFMRSRITTLSEEDLWEEARRRESESLRELQAASSFQAVDEQGSYTRVVRGMRYSPTGTPRRRTRLELTGDYVPIDRDQLEPSVSAINVEPQHQAMIDTVCWIQEQTLWSFQEWKGWSVTRQCVLWSETTEQLV